MSDKLIARIEGGRAQLFRKTEPDPTPAPERSRLLLPTPVDSGFGEHFDVDGHDPRLPRLGVITALSRQAARRIQRGKGPRCHRCPRKVTVAAEAVFDDGHEAHRSCSEGRNATLAKAHDELAASDARARAERFGLTDEVVNPLWTPPTTTSSEPEPKLDLSKGKLLGEPSDLRPTGT